MATDLNTVVLIGRVTRDPEFKRVGEGSSLVNFSIANNRTYMANQVKKEETHFFDCVAWGKLAEIIKEYATKGKQILVEGRLVQETWDTPEGKKASRIRIRVENMQLLGTRPAQEGATPRATVETSGVMKEYLEEVPAEDIF